jgi:hypothetical protein
MPVPIRNTSIYDETGGKADFAMIYQELYMEGHSMLLSDQAEYLEKICTR